MALTYFYAQLFGLTILIVGLGMLMNRRDTTIVLNEIMGNRALLYLAGLISLFLGLVVVLTHNLWSVSVLTLVVTLLGWALMLRGVLVLCLPHKSISNLFKSFELEKMYYLVTLATILVGVYLASSGFIGR